MFDDHETRSRNHRLEDPIACFACRFLLETCDDRDRGQLITALQVRSKWSGTMNKEQVTKKEKKKKEIKEKKNKKTKNTKPKKKKK